MTKRIGKFARLYSGTFARLRSSADTRRRQQRRSDLLSLVAAEVSRLEDRCLLSSSVIGSENLVNSPSLVGDQKLSRDRSIAVADSGTVISVWSSTSGADSSIVAQKVALDGSLIGAAFQVSTPTAGVAATNAVIDAIGNDRIVVAWQSTGAGRTGTDLYGAIFTGDSTTPKSFTISSALGNQADASIAWLSPSRFVVAWTGPFRGANQTVAQIFDDSGQKVGEAFGLSRVQQPGARSTVVTPLPDGGFQAAWIAPGVVNKNTFDIFSQRFDNQGKYVGNRFLVNAASVANEQQPALAGDGKQVVVAWQVPRGNSGFDILAQRIDLTGKKLGSAFTVNESALGDQTDPSVAMLKDGGFVVTWRSFTRTGTSTQEEIELREFKQDGTPLFGTRQVNTTDDGSHKHPTVRAQAPAGYVVAWAGNVSYRDTDGNLKFDSQGVGLQRFGDPFMPASTQSSLSDVLTVSIDKIGVIAEVSPKTITFTNTTDQTIYPILESANNNAVTTNANGNLGKGLYDPYDDLNKEYRGYIGYKDEATGRFFLGLRPGQTITIQVPLVFWDAGRILIASDGSNLIPLVDNAIDNLADPTRANSPNPFNYQSYQNFKVTEAVLQKLTAAQVPQEIVDAVRTQLLDKVFHVLSPSAQHPDPGDSFEGSLKLAIPNVDDYSKYHVIITNLAGQVIDTKRFIEVTPDGVTAPGRVMWYKAEGVAGEANGPSGGAPFQLAEMTFRSDIFANPNFLTHKDIDPTGGSGEVHNLVNYDVSYVDSMLLPVAIQAIEVPLETGNPTSPKLPYGWIGADKTIDEMRKALSDFTSDTRANGLGNYFEGGKGYPSYYIPSQFETLTGIKVPAGQNLSFESPDKNQKSPWDQNRFILTSAGTGAIDYGSPGASFAEGNFIYFDAVIYQKQIQAIYDAVVRDKLTLLVSSNPSVFPQDTKVISTGFDMTPVGGLIKVPVDQSIPAKKDGGVYTFSRPHDDYVIGKLTKLWYSWANYYADLHKIPDLPISGKIKYDTNLFVFDTPVPVDAAKLVEGMQLKLIDGKLVKDANPNMTGASILGFNYQDEARTIIESVRMSKLSLFEYNKKSVEFTFSAPQEIKYTNEVVQAEGKLFDFEFTDAEKKKAEEFAEKVYLVMDSMSTIAPISGEGSNSLQLMGFVLGCLVGKLQGVGNVAAGQPGGINTITNEIRDDTKSIMRGVADFVTDPESNGNWYPDPSVGTPGVKVDTKDADFGVYNLNPFVWFVHKKLNLSGYGFSVDDDTADVGADGASKLRIVVGDFDKLSDPQFFKVEWSHGAPFGPVKSTTGTLSKISDPQSQFDGYYKLYNLETNVSRKVFGTGSNGEPGALVSGPGIPAGTRILREIPAENAVILNTKTIGVPQNPSDPFYFSGLPPKALTPARATPVNRNTFNLSVLGYDSTYGESNLNYSWSLVNSPAGAKATFRPGQSTPSNALKNSQVSITGKPGEYLFRVTIAEKSNVGGFFTTSDVKVVLK